MYKDSRRFIGLVDQVYEKIGATDLIVGRSVMNDCGQENPVGTKANINAAFDAAASSGADLLLFHFSDHGGGNYLKGPNDGKLIIYGQPKPGSKDYYYYNDLFA